MFRVPANGDKPSFLCLTRVRSRRRINTAVTMKTNRLITLGLTCGAGWWGSVVFGAGSRERLHLADDVLELAALLRVKYKEEATGQFGHANLITVLNANGEIVHQFVGLGQDIKPTVRDLE
jgi:hypothetical protein